ncbi:hypothetical protein ACLIMP_03635 [Novosphingobium aerophilum]|uniref:hypothetical protein n=1 Tax=Novosphingobium TaxID=165696 RepID=UPI0012E0F860|nr:MULTISPECIES: hypothetical protein [unclassified Novosphingobium]WRT93366.1 hypothetical protein U9J33_02315 [Novosphingobium sp. RL4]
MARIVALALSAHGLRPQGLKASNLTQAGALRGILVCGCALALILAKASLPF